MKTLVLTLLIASTLVAAAQGPASVAIVANANDAESMALAVEYALGRGIPTNQIAALDLPTGETVSRGFYELRLRDPLLQKLREWKLIEQTRRTPASVQLHESEWSTVRSSLKYLVCMKGVPLRIADQSGWLADKVERRLKIGGNDGAAVDSELSLLLSDPYPLKGWMRNPLRDRIRWDDLGTGANKLVLACRLDGPDAASVRREMADALWAEKYGIPGRAYFDLRAPHNDDYLIGDHWLLDAWARVSLAGYEYVVERQDPTFGRLFPMSQPGLYFGWYTPDVDGPFLEDGFKFERGAVAYHLHSGNAATIRSTSTHWTGPLLARGACATIGTVDEPYLEQTVDVSMFADRLCSGLTFGESAYMAMPSLSWQSTVIGDPLYAPFRLSLDEQIRNMEKDGIPEVEWGYLRKVNQLVHDGRFNFALRYAREKIQATDSLALRERLADLLAINELFPDAATTYEAILEKTKDVRTAMRVTLRLGALLRAIGQAPAADELETKERERWKDSPYVALLNRNGA